jgi:dihydrolipoamide dehydrogenase
MKEYDVVVIGAGPGGYVAAIRTSPLGLRTAIVEKQYWGGVCLNIGCTLSKALLRNAELVHLFTHEAKIFGIRVNGTVTFDYAEAFQRSRKVADGRVKGVHFLMRKNMIDEYLGWASFEDEHTVHIQLNSGEQETFRFQSCILAAGATTRLLPKTQVSERVVTYAEQIMTDALPNSMIIIGAGAIGVEFAYILNSYGVQVTLVEYMDRIVPLEDEEISKELQRQFERNQIKVLTKTRVESLETSSNEVKVTVTLPNGTSQILKADKVMQAIGFQPRVDGYGLEKIGVQLSKPKGIVINSKMQTNLPHIYAIGDVTGKSMLAHVAEAMGIVAAENIAQVPTIELDYEMMPRATYCQPQIASFGLTEAQARERYDEIVISKFPFQANAKAQGIGDYSGFVKLIIDKKYGELLGAHMIGQDVAELLPELTLAHQAELTANEIARNIHAHPTLSEAIQEAAHGFDGHMINL